MRMLVEEGWVKTENQKWYKVYSRCMLRSLSLSETKCFELFSFYTESSVSPKPPIKPYFKHNFLQG